MSANFLEIADRAFSAADQVLRVAQTSNDPNKAELRQHVLDLCRHADELRRYIGEPVYYADTTPLTINRADLEALHNIRKDIRRLSSLLAAFLEIEEYGTDKIDDGVIRDIFEIIQNSVNNIFDDAETLFIRAVSSTKCNG